MGDQISVLKGVQNHAQEGMHILLRWRVGQGSGDLQPSIKELFPQPLSLAMANGVFGACWLSLRSR